MKGSGKVQTFLMMGRPGSGKGTQASMLAQRLGGKVYSSGEKLREMARSGTYFGNKSKEVMDRGDLMPIWVSQYLFENALIQLEPTDIIIFEGSCRIVEEAQRFHEAATWLGRPYKAIYLNAPEETLKDRLRKRHIEGRADDSEAVLNERFNNFTELTLKSIEYFKSEGTLVEVQGDRHIDEVFADILKALELE